jgi:hypothetical protein
MTASPIDNGLKRVDRSQSTYRAHAPSDGLQQLTTNGSQVVARRRRPRRRQNVALAPSGRRDAGSARRLRPASLPPSFLSSSPTTVRRAWTGGRQGNKRWVGATRRRSRGHGPARLDGARPRATVADKGMKSGKADRQATGAALAQTPRKRSAQARIEEPGRRRKPTEGRERRQLGGGRDALAGSMRSTTARPGHVWWAGDARNEVAIGHTRLRGPRREKSRGPGPFNLFEAICYYSGKRAVMTMAGRQGSGGSHGIIVSRY